MYGISERIIKKIILEHLDDDLLFEKIKDEISEYINSDEFQSNFAELDAIENNYYNKTKINEMLHWLCNKVKSDIIGTAKEDFDTLGEISNWIEIYKNDLRVYTEAEINKTGDEQAVIEWLQNNQQLRNSAYDYMFFCGKDGTTYRDTGLVGSKGGVLERDYYKAMMISKQDVFVGEMVLSKTSNQYVIPIARAAKDANGNIFGFYVGMLGFKTLSDKITSFTVGETGYAFLLDKAGKIISAKALGI